MNPLDQIVCQYKKGYKTSEFWVALAAGGAQALAAAFDPSQPLNKQLSNLTWVAIAYILARSGLKVARATSQARVASSVAFAAPVAAAATAAVSANGSSDGGITAEADGEATNGMADAINQLRLLVDLRDRGILSEPEFELEKSRVLA